MKESINTIELECNLENLVFKRNCISYTYNAHEYFLRNYTIRKDLNEYKGKIFNPNKKIIISLDLDSFTFLFKDSTIFKSVEAYIRELRITHNITTHNAKRQPNNRKEREIIVCYYTEIKYTTNYAIYKKYRCPFTDISPLTNLFIKEIFDSIDDKIEITICDNNGTFEFRKNSIQIKIIEKLKVILDNLKNISSHITKYEHRILIEQITAEHYNNKYIYDIIRKSSRLTCTILSIFYIKLLSRKCNDLNYVLEIINSDISNNLNNHAFVVNDYILYSRWILFNYIKKCESLKTSTNEDIDINYTQDYIDDSFLKYIFRITLRKEKHLNKDIEIRKLLSLVQCTYLNDDFDHIIKSKFGLTSHGQKIQSKENKRLSRNTEIGSEISNFSKKEESDIKYIDVLCNINNIDFSNGYYDVIIVNKENIKNDKISPLRIREINSYKCFNLIKKYFKDYLEKSKITIKYTKDRVVSINNRIELNNYISILKNKQYERGEWSFELENIMKRTLDECRQANMKDIVHQITNKNIYIDYLLGHQLNYQLIKAYEIINFQQEDCFIFTANSSYNNCVSIIFENINFARSTEIFIARKDQYEKCINHIFDYFTQYNINQKRSIYKSKKISSSEFEAENYFSISHNNINSWAKQIKTIINFHSNKSHLLFKAGLITLPEQELRLLKPTITVTNNIHDVIKRKLYKELIDVYGTENVGTENHLGNKIIDVVVQFNKMYSFYEIKSNVDVRICIREAIGQIIDYAYFDCDDSIDKLYIVGPSKIDDKSKNYLEKIRKTHNLPIYYIQVSPN